MPPNWLKKKEPRRFSFRNRALCFASMNKRTPAHSCPSKGPILDVDRASSSSKREAQKNKRSSCESFHDNLVAVSRAQLKLAWTKALGRWDDVDTGDPYFKRKSGPAGVRSLPG